MTYCEYISKRALETLSLLNSYVPKHTLERHTVCGGEDGSDVYEIIVYTPNSPIETRYGNLTTGFIVKLYNSDNLPVGFNYKKCTLPTEIKHEVCGFFGNIGFSSLGFSSLHGKFIMY